MDRKMIVLIVDDQLRSRQSLRALLASWPAVTAIHEAETGEEGLRAAGDCRPDLILIDSHTKKLAVLDITRRIKDCWPKTAVVILSMYNDLESDGMKAGADGFVTKGDPPEILMRVLEAVTEQRGKN